MSQLTPISSEKQNLLDFLTRCNFNSVDEKTIQGHVNALMMNHTVRVYHTKPGMFLYRGIKYETKPESWSQLIYPPKSFAKINRASLNGEPMFYCSTLKKVPFYELFIEKGDRLVLTTWILNKQSLFANIGYTKSNLSQLGTSRIMPFDFPESEKNEIDTENDAIANYLSSAFCKVVLPGEESYYKLTNAIAKQFLFINVETRKYGRRLTTSEDILSTNPEDYNPPQEFPGIQYPTIHNNGIEENFAIKPEAIDDNLLALDKVEYIEIVNKSESNFRYKLLDIAFNINNSRINWKNLNRNWEFNDDQDEVVFVEDNDVVQAYTIDGEPIEPI